LEQHILIAYFYTYFTCLLWNSQKSCRNRRWINTKG